MDKVCHSNGTLFSIHHLAEELAWYSRHTIHLRCLYNKENTLDMVEEIYQSACRNRYELGGCHRIRSGSGIFRQSVFLSELRHSVVFTGEVVACGRLSVRKQDELWSKGSTDSASHAAYSAHASGVQLQIVSGMA